MTRKRMAKDGDSAPAGEPRGETAYLKLKDAIRSGDPLAASEALRIHLFTRKDATDRE